MSSLPNTTRSPCSVSSSCRIGSTALHGPHQGAQKSTITGRSACRTSRSKFSSVSSSTAAMLQAAEQRLEAEKRHLPDRLEHDRAAHLRVALLAVREADRDLDDTEALAQSPVGRLDLEGVASRSDRVEVDSLEHLAPVALEAAGRIADRHQEQARVDRRAHRDRAAHEAPVRDCAALDIPRAEHEIGFRGRLDQPRDVGRAVREVAVHLEHELCAVRERLPEACEVGGTETVFARAVEDGHFGELVRQAVGQLTGPIRRAVIDHEHGDAVLAESVHHRLEVLAFVVGGQADGRAHVRIIAVVATTLPRNADVAEQLELLADLLEIEGEAAFRVLAYRRAATRVRETGGPVAQLALDGEAKKLPGIGATIEQKIVQIVDKGEIEALAKRRKTIPPEVVDFLRIPGLGPKTVRKIWQELGVTTLADLKEAARAQRLRTLPGLGAKVEENILKSVGRKKKATGPPRTLLGRALPALLAVVEVLREHPAADRVSEAGSARRRRETVRDLDIIATASDPKALIEYFTKLTWVSEVAAKGPTKATVVSHEGYRFDLRVVPPECYGNLLQHFTGSKEHNMALREDAVRRGFSVSEYGITEVESGEVFTARDEEEVYERLAYAYIPPELRENAGELQAARDGGLPELVERGALRGDLHTHSHWSADGKNTLAEMVAAAEARGYAYYAITDHSHYLREGRMEEQANEIDRLAKKVAPLKLLKGVEVNIKADGTLDVPDEVLAERDWVVASIHTAFDRSPTERVMATMENPHVDVIGHLTGRKLNRREPMEIDLERVVAKALETGTSLEINPHPARLDLRDVDARLAGEAGVKIVISSDAHQVAALEYVDFGVAQARRAWLGPEQIANTRSWAQMKRLMKKS